MTSIRSTQAVIVFVKNPILGKVKTRLASTVGDTQALDIYIKLLHKTRDLMLEVDADRYVFYDSHIAKNDLWADNLFYKELQHQSRDLGERMFDAFRRIFRSYEHVVIIGSDCPLLSAQIITDALSALRQCDVSIGPTEDGGYYLLGMQQLVPELFRGIEWSTDTVYADTMTVLREQGLSHSVLPMLPDIDYESDWIKYGW